MFSKSLTTIGMAAAIMAMPATAQTLRFHSLWQEGDRRAGHTGLLSQSEFESRAQAFLADGLRLSGGALLGLVAFRAAALATGEQ